MQAWVWLAAYLIGFALLQLVLYRYFRRGESTGEGATRAGDHTGARADAGPETGVETGTERSTEHPDPHTADGAGITCQHCGAVNEAEATFTYCRRCTEPLQ